MTTTTSGLQQGPGSAVSSCRRWKYYNDGGVFKGVCLQLCNIPPFAPARDISGDDSRDVSRDPWSVRMSHAEPSGAPVSQLASSGGISEHLRMALWARAARTAGWDGR